MGGMHSATDGSFGFGFIPWVSGKLCGGLLANCEYRPAEYRAVGATVAVPVATGLSGWSVLLRLTKRQGNQGLLLKFMGLRRSSGWGGICGALDAAQLGSDNTPQPGS
jgi:hypothetical protein